MSNVWVCRMLFVPLTTGDSTLLMVPSTTLGKNMMQNPSTNGRSKGYTSTGSALERDCHTRYAT